MVEKFCNFVNNCKIFSAKVLSCVSFKVFSVQRIAQSQMFYHEWLGLSTRKKFSLSGLVPFNKLFSKGIRIFLKNIAAIKLTSAVLK